MGARVQRQFRARIVVQRFERSQIFPEALVQIHETHNALSYASSHLLKGGQKREREGLGIADGLNDVVYLRQSNDGRREQDRRLSSFARTKGSSCKNDPTQDLQGVAELSKIESGPSVMSPMDLLISPNSALNLISWSQKAGLLNQLTCSHVPSDPSANDVLSISGSSRYVEEHE